MNLTKNEKVVIEKMQKDAYLVKYGESETDPMDGWFEDQIINKVLRGVLASLIKKEAITYYGNLPENKHCRNPLCKGDKWDEAVASL